MRSIKLLALAVVTMTLFSACATLSGGQAERSDCSPLEGCPRRPPLATRSRVWSPTTLVRAQLRLTPIWP
jgi:hypothetical protein